MTQRLDNSQLARDKRRVKYRSIGAFTLIELLLALSLLSTLMVAVGVAVDASLYSYAENEKIADFNQVARVILTRMSHEIRTAAAVDSTDSEITIIPPGGGDVTQIQYAFEGGTLYYRRTTGSGMTESVLVAGDENVHLTTFYVIRETGLDWQGLSCTKSLTIRMGFTSGGETFWITASASPRRNQLY